jgi:hypothetical protein
MNGGARTTESGRSCVVYVCVRCERDSGKVVTTGESGFGLDGG